MIWYCVRYHKTLYDNISWFFLQYLLKDKRAKALLNEPDKFEDTALHLAASKGFDEIVRVCIT